MRIGLICPEVTGHLNPLTSLGAELFVRGHEVVLIGGRQTQDIADKQRLHHIPLGTSDESDRRIAAGWKQLGSLSGYAAMRATGRVLADSTLVTLRDLPPLLEQQHWDGLIVDQFSPAALVAAEQRKIPCVIACNALSGHYDPWIPPPVCLWEYRTDALSLLRNQLAKFLLPPLYNWFSNSRTTGVKPLKLAFEHDHGLAHIAQQPAFFEFPRQSTPEHLHYTGPWHQTSRDDDIRFPWGQLDQSPLIYASLGTLQNNQRDLYQTIADAVAGLDVQMVLSQGGSAENLNLDLPQNVLLVRYAPQIRLLERADLFITHAGLNSVLEGMSRGVPMLCLPITNDQPGIAVRVRWLGIGEYLSTGRLGSSQLRRLIVGMLQNPKYETASRAIQRKLEPAAGLTLAADIVEKALTTKRKVLREEFQPVPAFG